MSSSSEYPKLRWPIDIQMHQAGNERVIVIRCPIGLTDKPLVLVSGVAPILGAFEGNKSIAEIESEFSSYGVTRPLIDELLNVLDSHLFLSNDRFFSAQEKLKLDFLNSPVRPAALAGGTYASNPIDLRREVDALLETPPHTGFDASAQAGRGDLAVLVSPHIDYRRGGSCYGRAYQQIRADTADLYIVIGTAHQYSSLLFHLTKKDFITPLGPLPCDHLFVEELAHRYGYQRSFADELLHRREHSLELQLPFLSRLKPDAKIVPILVGSFHTMLAKSLAPKSVPEYDQFVAALVEAIQSANRNGKRVAFIAGVDMAHVGRHFGDQESLSPDSMRNIGARDQLYLDAIARLDKEALFSHIAEDGDMRKICGFPTMYTILDVCERLNWRLEARIFDYQQAVDYQSDCAVTFAAVGLFHKHQPNQAI